MTPDHHLGRNARVAGVEAVFGVPDSLMKQGLWDLEEEFGPESFTIAANEGAAVAQAIGHYLATAKLPLVFMQNSGLGNAINPLVSLADSKVYSLPMILLIGWRGEILEAGGQKSDEPQHVKQGQITSEQLQLLGIPAFVMSSAEDISDTVAMAAREAISRVRPVAILVRSGVLIGEDRQQRLEEDHLASREDMVRAVCELTGQSGLLSGTPVVATTGMASRELFESRSMQSTGTLSQDFLTVGGMGHAISIASAIAHEIVPRKVICLDGDGAVLMHLGGLLHAAKQPNLIHIVLDNGVHDSVGGQPTGFREIDLEAMVRSLGYSRYVQVISPTELSVALGQTLSHAGSILIHAVCNPGHRSNLARPSRSPQESKQGFMSFLKAYRNG